ncbi:MAG: alcohol dehydrogenase catalytic domain-containing protein [Kiritimatiellae bacterium]|nr:alcohol dehydrogenase catalytic domain-containing protein [Kiritimatiellia bacterium]
MWVWELHRAVSLRDEPAPLRRVERPVPEPEPGQVRLKVEACGVCHTELDEIEGRAPPPVLPVVPGHQIVGRVDRVGAGVAATMIGHRVGVAWIAAACGRCARCREGRENLCAEFQATGRDVDGGYAQFALARADYVYPIPERLDSVAAAPLLCAGAVGWRALKLSGLRNGETLGLTGFGASGHLVARVVRCRWPASPIFVFARSEAEREFARELGAAWAGDTWDQPPAPVDRMIDTTPAWTPVAAALRRLAPGGRLVINAIRKEPADRAVMAELDYARDLWMEREIISVANVTRADVREFLELAAEIELRPEVQIYPFGAANEALRDLYHRKIRGAKVLVMDR